MIIIALILAHFQLTVFQYTISFFVFLALLSRDLTGRYFHICTFSYFYYFLLIFKLATRLQVVPQPCVRTEAAVAHWFHPYSLMQNKFKQN